MYVDVGDAISIASAAEDAHMAKTAVRAITARNRPVCRELFILTPPSPEYLKYAPLYSFLRSKKALRGSVEGLFVTD